MNEKHVEWCSIPVIVDDTVAELIHMPKPNQDAKQTPQFRVTKATIGLVPLDFDRYKPSLERMAVTWHEEKKREMAKVRVTKTSSPS